jgi:hypothetical protein
VTRSRATVLLGGLLLLSACGEEEPVLEPGPEAPPVYALEWGTRGEGEGEFYQPGDIDVAPDGSVLVVDHQNARIQKFTPDGTFVAEWGHGPPTGNIFSRLISGVAVGWGKIYVSDFQQATWVLDENGNPLEFWDYFSLYGGLAVNTYGNIFISGYKILSRYPLFIIDGPAVWALTRDGKEFGRYNLDTYAITPGPQGTLYGVRVGYRGNEPYSSVIHFTSGGRVLSSWPVTAESATIDNISADPEGHVYLACRAMALRPYQGVLKLNRTGQIISQWTETGGTWPRFSWPTSVALGPQGELYVSDFWNDRVVKFLTVAEAP